MRALLLLASCPSSRAMFDREDDDLRARRGLEPHDRRTVNDITTRCAGDGYHFQTLMFIEIAKSLPFQSRRGEAKTWPEGTLMFNT